MSDTVQPLFTWRSSISESGLAPTSRHVAIALSLYMNERGASAFPGAARLARDTGLGERTIREHLGLLVEAGYLEIVEKGGLKGETRRANHYRACTPASAAPVHLSASTPASDDTDPCSSRTPLLHESLHGIHQGGRGRKSAPETLLEHFDLTDERKNWAKKECPDIDAILHTKRFVNHFKGEEIKKRDWERTWRNWLLKEQERVPQWVKSRSRSA